LDLTSLVKSILSLLKTSISKKATLVLDLKENLGFINADKAQIQQIILNLIINASESLGENNGTIQINTGFQECGVNDLKQSRVVDDLDAGTYLFIEVIDSGCGMEPSVLNHLFEPFFTTKFTGRGLGLSAVLGIVKRHKGAIFVNSEPQKGTKFKALFPKIDTVEPVIKNDGGTKKAESFIKFFHGKVLLIDDDESILKVCESMLKRLGFNVLTAKNGALGLELFKDNRPELDLVILDLTMPEMDGMSTFIEIKRIKPDQRIILSSGFDAHEVSVKFADKGIGGFLQKPYQFNELKGLLEKIYREKSEKKA
jgi:CheY-like chemotaxis protein